jgi:alcohol dehydrogenase YqhD (iron-dependent ADH family)
MFDVAHGAGLAAVWGSWARYVCATKPARFARFAVKVLDVADKGDDMATALAGIEAMEDFFRSIGMPVSIGELGVKPTDEQIAEMALKCSHFGERTIGSFKPLNQEDMANIYKNAK